MAHSILFFLASVTLTLLTRHLLSVKRVDVKVSFPDIVTLLTLNYRHMGMNLHTFLTKFKSSNRNQHDFPNLTSVNKRERETCIRIG